MDYISGGDLMTQLISRNIFSEDESRFYIAELVLALEAIHNMNCIHRDIKPDNILIDKEGHIKLSDFGLCKIFVSVFMFIVCILFQITVIKLSYLFYFDLHI